MSAITDFFKKLVVLEMSNILAGPSVGMFFAELGARVIKVENGLTQGDNTRHWKLPQEDPNTDISAYFSAVNWGKESIAVDLTTRVGKKIVRDLIQKSDVLIQSYKPGDEEKFGLDYPTVKNINPKIIYGHITAFGPDDDRPGFDAIIQAESGFMFMNGAPDGPPTKMPVALIDLLLAHQLKEAFLLALLQREMSGDGSYIAVSLLQSAISSLANQAANWLVAGHIPQRLGSEHPNIAPYGTIFQTKDQRELVLAVGANHQFRTVLKILDLSQYLDDGRFSTNPQRVRHRVRLNQLLSQKIIEFDSDELTEKFRKNHIPFGFVNDMPHVFELPAAQELVRHQSTENNGLTGVSTIAFQSDFITRADGLKPPPHLNQHKQEILAGFLGYTNAQLSEYEKANRIQS